MNRNDRVGIHLSDAAAGVAAQMSEITVRIRGPRGRHGSGTVWRPDGLVITNAHVADSHVLDVELLNGRSATGWLIARDPETDLAALAVSLGPCAAASVRSARGLRAGEMVFALGNPADGPAAITTGIVHTPVGNSPWLFADIRLAPGNSGGPLADASGAVVGINSMIVGGLGCAVPSDAVDAFLRRFHLAEAA